MSEEDISMENIDFSCHDLNGQQEWDDSGDVAIAATSTIDPIYDKQGVISWLSNSKPIRGIIIHHTYSPSSSQYTGRNTILAIKNYHMSHGWSDIAANFYTTPTTNGLIGYTARSLTVQNGAHAYVERSWSEVPADFRILANGDKQHANTYCIGIETVANLDVEDPTTSKSMRNSIKLMAIICEYHGFGVDKIWPHRALASKSCPGNRVNMDWLREEVKKEMGNGEDCKDLPASNYAVEALQWAMDQGLMVGDGTNQFPRCNITREDFITILYRYHNQFVNN